MVTQMVLDSLELWDVTDKDILNTTCMVLKCLVLVPAGFEKIQFKFPVTLGHQMW